VWQYRLPAGVAYTHRDLRDYEDTPGRENSANWYGHTQVHWGAAGKGDHPARSYSVPPVAPASEDLGQMINLYAPAACLDIRQAIIVSGHRIVFEDELAGTVPYGVWYGHPMLT